MSVWVELAVFHLLWVPMMISWLHCVLLDPGSLDQEWKAYLQETFSTEGSSVNYCTKSNLFKPPRAHFCRMSERLILNMDHFCPWIGNTVGFCNRKFFILFLFYTCLTCSFAAISFAVRIGRCYIDEDHEGCGYMIWLKVVFVKDFVLAVVLGRFGAFHWQMACQNETSIERLLNSKPEYDLSRSDNLRQVFGLEKWSWFVPLSCGGPSIDGISWPTRELTSEEIAKRSKSANSI